MSRNHSYVRYCYHDMTAPQNQGHLNFKQKNEPEKSIEVKPANYASDAAIEVQTYDSRLWITQTVGWALRR